MQAAGGSGSGRLAEAPVSASTIMGAGAGLASELEGMGDWHATHAPDGERRGG